MAQIVAENGREEKITLLEEDDHYTKCFGVWLAKSLQVPRQHALLCSNLEKAEWLNNRERNHARPRVLSVGPGRGDTDIPLIEAMQQVLERNGKATAISYTVVDPNPRFIEIFKERAENKLRNVDFLWHCCTIEEFAKKHAATPLDQQMYDVVYFIHSMYYFLDIEHTLSFALDKLIMSHGAVNVVAGTPDSYPTKISNGLLSKEERSKKHQKTIDDVLLLEKTFHRFNFEKMLTNHPIDLACIFEEGSKDGDLLLDFLTHKKDFRSYCRTDVVSDTVDFLHKSSRKEGKQYLVYDDIVLVSLTSKQNVG